MLLPKAVLSSRPAALFMPLALLRLCRLISRYVKVPRLILRYVKTPRLVRRLCKAVAWMAVFQLVAVGAVMASFAVPDEVILDRLVDARRAGQLALKDSTYPPHRTIVEWGGECCLFTQYIAFDGAGLLKRFAAGPSLCYCEYTNEQLAAYERGEDITLWNYFRYWHGLSVLVRPLLALFGVDGVRYVAFALALGASVWLSRVVFRRSGYGSVAALWGPVVLAGGIPPLMSACHHTLQLAVGWAGAAVVGTVAHRQAGGGRGWTTVAAVAAAAGAAYGFVHRGAFIAGVCAVTAAVAFVCSRNRRVSADLLAPILAWSAAFAAMWASKWVWTIAAYPDSDVVGNLANIIPIKTVGDSQGRTDGGVGAWTVWEAWQRDWSLAHAVAVGAACILVVAVVRGSWRSVVPAAAVAVWSIAVMLGQNNHLDGHVWFDFRLMPMIIGAVLLVSVADARQRRERRNARWLGKR